MGATNASEARGATHALRWHRALDSATISAMRVLLTKISEERHRLDIVRSDGSAEGRELDTRSFLVHDLAHFAVEQQAHLEGGFWGSLAAGLSFDGLAASPEGDERWRAERLAAPFQTLWRVRNEPAFAARRAHYIDQLDVDDIFVDGALARMHHLWGRWKATRFRSVLELHWALRG